MVINDNHPSNHAASKPVPFYTRVSDAAGVHQLDGVGSLFRPLSARLRRTSPIAAGNNGSAAGRTE